MIDAAKYNEVETLKNGTVVNIRSIRADDKNRIAEAFRNLEAESVYTRFFCHKNALSDAELKVATEVDFENVVALVVTVRENGIETIIGGGRYSAVDAGDPRRSAEVAFIIEEDYQRQGIACSLMRHLVRIAREKGVRQFEAEVLPSNKAMLKAFSRSNLPMKTTFEEDVVHVTLSLMETSA